MDRSWRDLASTYVLRRLASSCPNFGDRDGVRGRRSEIGDDFVVRQKSDKDDKEKVPSRRARRGLKETMLRGDYVEDKSRFELRKHTGVILLI